MFHLLQILFGLFFCYGSVWSLIKSYKYAWKGIKTTGTIIKSVKDEADDEEYGYSPLVRFYDGNNNVHEVKSDLGLGKGNFVVGNSITIYYNPENPSQMSVFNWKLNFGIGAFFLVGLSQIALGILFLLNVID
jgi:hypothetical protein